MPRGGQKVAERLRQAVETLQIPHATCDRGHVTLSLGCATLASGLLRDGMQTPADLLQAADQALYRAKAAGRNRVMVAQD
ncbi:diguanylate cyclase [Ectothiorhodospira mobilis]|uniref:diguanylate cyclase n=1 Tax=Ectothiorhodospira mobilis TaxID=195064 RepID=UPI003F6B2EC1